MRGIFRRSHARFPAPAGARTPLDTAGARDTLIIFRLEPYAWAWEATPGKALFMKDGQRHNPFASPMPMPGHPRDLAVCYQAPTSLDGCRFEYNLGIIVRQNGLETPLVIDPGRDGSGVGN